METLMKQLDIINVDYEKAMNGQECVVIVERYFQLSKSFDIVLMDLHMPIMNGY